MTQVGKDLISDTAMITFANCLYSDQPAYRDDHGLCLLSYT